MMRVFHLLREMNDHACHSYIDQVLNWLSYLASTERFGVKVKATVIGEGFRFRLLLQLINEPV